MRALRMIGTAISALFLLAWVVVSAEPNSKTVEPLGEQLYSAHCGGCHSTQVHWRSRRIARNWPDLVAQVKRWEYNIGLEWSDAEIVAVARYLNLRYYHFARKDEQAFLSDARR